MAQVIEGLHKPLHSNPSTSKEKGKKDVGKNRF
jgi:hypothetical protein